MRHDKDSHMSVNIVSALQVLILMLHQTLLKLFQTILQPSTYMKTSQNGYFNVTQPLILPSIVLMYIHFKIIFLVRMRKSKKNAQSSILLSTKDVVCSELINILDYHCTSYFTKNKVLRIWQELCQNP